MNNNQNMCVKCKSPLEPNAAFCTSCGEKINPITPAVVSNLEVYTCPMCKRKLPPGNSFCVTCNQSVEVSNAVINNTDIKCNKCGNILKVTDDFCTGCGQKKTLIVKPTVTNAPFVAVDPAIAALPSASDGSPLGAVNIFGYGMTEEQMVNELINKEIAKSGESSNVTIAAVEKKKNIFTIVYAIILFICVSLFFFHAYTGVLIFVFFIVTIIFINSVKKYDLIKYLNKEIKSRPDEKIGYIVSSVMAGKINKSKYILFRLLVMIIAVIIPLFIFSKNYVIYEYDSTNNGYVIRFYTTTWLENETTLEIPNEYKGESVVGIRGDVFANVYALKKVVLPDTIKEIRGGAFKNAINLEEINLPEGIPEIKGETFQGCGSLKEITIPDSVTRIGGHAFRGNSSLSKVNISPNSKLTEIGSSAFRECYELDEIYLPKGVYVNSRAFKGNYTNVKEYGIDGIVYEDIYLYNTERYISVEGSVEEVNPYDEEALVQDCTIQLVSVDGNYGNYSFTLLFSGNGQSITFKLDRDNPTYQVNENLLFSIDSDYVFNSYSNRVTVVAYYN